MKASGQVQRNIAKSRETPREDDEEEERGDRLLILQFSPNQNRHYL